MESVQKAMRLSSFDQRAARQVMFEHSATADAVMIVGGVYAVVIIASFLTGSPFDLFGLLEGIIRGIAGWLFLSFAIWVMGTKVIKGNGDPQTMIRTSGFATLPLVLGAFNFYWGQLGRVGLAWHLGLLVMVAKVVLGITWIEAGAAVGLGAALIYLIQSLLGATFFRF